MTLTNLSLAGIDWSACSGSSTTVVVVRNISIQIRGARMVRGEGGRSRRGVLQVVEPTTVEWVTVWVVDTAIDWLADQWPYTPVWLGSNSSTTSMVNVDVRFVSCSVTIDTSDQTTPRLLGLVYIEAQTGTRLNVSCTNSTITTTTTSTTVVVPPDVQLMSFGNVLQDSRIVFQSTQLRSSNDFQVNAVRLLLCKAGAQRLDVQITNVTIASFVSQNFTVSYFNVTYSTAFSIGGLLLNTTTNCEVMHQHREG